MSSIGLEQNHFVNKTIRLPTANNEMNKNIHGSETVWAAHIIGIGMMIISKNARL
jgi:hypothetical protein